MAAMLFLMVVIVLFFGVMAFVVKSADPAPNASHEPRLLMIATGAVFGTPVLVLAVFWVRVVLLFPAIALDQ